MRKLPMQPGVYLHKDKTGKVIYVGKAKLLKNRVSNYFQAPERLNPKTRQLVSHIADFDIIVTETEFEALVLENSMIKKYKPKYNILLKDDKGYPYPENWTYGRAVSGVSPWCPSRGMTGRGISAPTPGRVAARRAENDTISEALHLKTCSRVFPRDIGKDRPCLNQHLGRCCAPCTGKVSPEEYHALIGQAVALFEGDAKRLEKELTEKMNEAAEELQFERAALLRDRLRAVQRLGTRQHVVAGAFARSWMSRRLCRGRRAPACACCTMAAARCRTRSTPCCGTLTESDPAEVLSSFIKQYYAQRGAVPEPVLLSHAL